jgi:N-acetylglucosamine malate deacetylase 1
MTKIALIVAHPDDEILGCGGTIASHAKAGDEVHVLILAEGITSRDNKRDLESRADELKKLKQTARDANNVLGVTSLVLHDFPDNRMDSVDRLDLIKVIEEFIVKNNPNIIYTHHPKDINIDHRCVNDAVIVASRPIPGSSVELLLFFETVSSTEWQAADKDSNFIPNWWVDISETLELKMQALETYQSEMRPWPHARSSEAVKHLAHWRGASIGCNAAEAFVLGRNIMRINIDNKNCPQDEN